MRGRGGQTRVGGRCRAMTASTSGPALGALQNGRRCRKEKQKREHLEEMEQGTGNVETGDLSIPDFLTFSP